MMEFLYKFKLKTQGCESYDMVFRILQLGSLVIVIDKLLVYYNACNMGRILLQMLLRHVE
jgi:hypothetical protein